MSNANDTFMYDMAKLKIFDRDPVKYRMEHASVTSESERIKPMFANGSFNRNTFNQVFEHFKKPDNAVTSAPAAMLSSKMPAYAYAMDGGQTMLRSDREFNGVTQFEQAYNSHSNPDDYTESLMETCKTKAKSATKEKTLSHAEIQSRLSKRGVSFSIPKGSKPDFTKPVENNSMIQEEEPPAPPLMDEEPFPIQPPPQFNPHIQQHVQQFNPHIQQHVQQFNQPQFQQHVQQFQQHMMPPQQFNPQIQQQYVPQQGRPQMPPDPVVKILPIDQQPEAPIRHKHKRPPIYNRSALSAPAKTQTDYEKGVSEIEALKRMVRKQEEQIARLLSTKHHSKN